MLKINRITEVLGNTGFGKTTLYKRIDDGLFPPSISLTGRIVGWPEHEVDAVLSGIISGKSNQEIKELVKELVQLRSTKANLHSLSSLVEINSNLNVQHGNL